MNLLRYRILTAIVILPCLFFLLVYGSKEVLALCLCLFVAIGSYELTQLLSSGFLKNRIDLQGASKDFKKSSYAMAFLVALFYLALIFIPEPLNYILMLAFTLFVILLLLSSFRKVELVFFHLVYFILSLVYLVGPFFLLWKLSLLGTQARFVFLLFAIVMASDTLAYFVGRSFGKRKFFTHLSPKKTVEGAIGGVLGGVLGAYLVNFFFPALFPSLTSLSLVACLVSVFGIFGDLLESCLKRFAAVKDSGTLLPGHGGILDRCDSILLAAPALWVSVRIYEIIV